MTAPVYVFFLVTFLHGEPGIFAIHDQPVAFTTRELCVQVMNEAAAEQLIPEGAKVACLKAEKQPDGSAKFVEDLPLEPKDML